MPEIRRRRSLTLRSDSAIVLHGQPLIRGAGLRDQRIDAADDAADTATESGVFEHAVAHLQRQGRGSLRDPRRSRSGGRSCNRASGSRCRSRKSGSARSRISSLVTVLLMTRRRRSEPVSGAMVSVRSPLSRSGRDDRRRQIVESQRGGADRIAHAGEAGQDAFDLRVIAQGDRDEAGMRRVRARAASARLRMRSAGKARTGR